MPRGFFHRLKVRLTIVCKVFQIFVYVWGHNKIPSRIGQRIRGMTYSLSMIHFFECMISEQEERRSVNINNIKNSCKA
jgi:hypothetical protein